ncbi:unnamed protein product [Amoebophrya sp. A120]|nr:unnamed protein product [Amoebophrya sp. A120]|eukprot:GSA120T00017450001.1
MDDAGKLKERGSSNTQVYKPYTIDMNETPYDIKELDHEVITSLRRKGQKDATVGGHTFRSGAGQAVSIPVSSFLEAAGVGNLDLPSMYSNHKYIADTTLQSSAALRATGINLAISISCARKDVSVFETQDMNIYCDMFADSEPTWTTREDGVHDEFVSRTGSGILKTKKQHGVKLNFRFTGRLGYFSTSIFLGSLTSAIVLLELPGKAVMLLALFCLGLLSRVYYSCQSQRLNLRHQVHGFAARLINAKKSYEAIVKSDKMDTHLDRATLAKEMTESFHHLCEEKDEHGEPIADPNKPLQKEELEKMTELVYQGLDADHEGSISLDEYVDASTSNEVLRVDQIVQFFDDQRQRSCLEKLFDDAKWDIETDEELRKRRKKDLPNETPRPAHAADIFMNL